MKLSKYTILLCRTFVLALHKDSQAISNNLSVLDYDKKFLLSKYVLVVNF